SYFYIYFFFFSSRRRHTRSDRDWSSDVCSSDLRGRRLQIVVARFLCSFRGKERFHRRLHRARRTVWQQSRQARASAAELARILQIGRASCRERVEISVGGG